MNLAPPLGITEPMKPNDAFGITRAPSPTRRWKRLVWAKSNPTSKRPISRWTPSSGPIVEWSCTVCLRRRWILAVLFCSPPCTKPLFPMYASSASGESASSASSSAVPTGIVMPPPRSRAKNMPQPPSPGGTTTADRPACSSTSVPPEPTGSRCVTFTVAMRCSTRSACGKTGVGSGSQPNSRSTPHVSPVALSIGTSNPRATSAAPRMSDQLSADDSSSAGWPRRKLPHWSPARNRSASRMRSSEMRCSGLRDDHDLRPPGPQQVEGDQVDEGRQEVPDVVPVVDLGRLLDEGHQVGHGQPELLDHLQRVRARRVRSARTQPVELDQRVSGRRRCSSRRHDTRACHEGLAGGRVGELVADLVAEVGQEVHQGAEEVGRHRRSPQFPGPTVVGIAMGTGSRPVSWTM